jgi:hypothetical protein
MLDLHTPSVGTAVLDTRVHAELSQVPIAKETKEWLLRHVPEFEIHFVWVAVTLDQLRFLKLPTRAAKRDGDAHAKQFNGDSVELDAIPPFELRRLVQTCIEKYVDKTKLAILRQAKASEREVLRRFAQS